MSESTKPKPFCFVLMPFNAEFDDIYNLGIKEACKEAGAYSERVDEQTFQERILDRIYNQISKADIIVADMTGKNPNVFYEVGYAHALGKSTILLTQNTDDIPFDLKHFPHIIYQKKITFLKTELQKKVRYFIENPKEKSEQNLGIEIYENTSRLSINDQIFDGKFSPHHDSYIYEIDLTIFNNSNITFSPGDFCIGLIFSKNFARISNNKNIKYIDLPDESKLATLPHFDRIFPQSFTSYKGLLMFNDINKLEIEAVIVRVFSSIGTRDYKISIRFRKE